MFEYTGCGLEGIFLKNGYAIEETPYGQAVSIADLDGLHRAIARDIIRQQSPMTGHQFRFLRKEQDLVQDELAAMFRVDVQTIANWEKKGKEAVPGAADIAMRAFYTAFIHVQFKPVPVAKDAEPDESATFEREDERWIDVEAA
ncbi:putative transcriptional regulator [Metapseudomonas resinovorans]|uniref:helix-turn-helix domain-containing protein n=1 Tax=Metapseudomonas resinovorans TaxID=53412 RepID=UPI003D1E4DFA